MGLIKDIYSIEFYTDFARCLSKTIPGFDSQHFISFFVKPEFIAKEWKDRMVYTTAVLNHFMPSNFVEAVAVIDATISEVKQSECGKITLAFMFFPDYIEKYGVNDFETSIIAFEKITQFISCEFAVRPFIINHPEQMLGAMQKWSLHSNHHVRRLASEGSRPRLPWAMAIPFLKNNPKPLFPILENLKK